MARIPEDFIQTLLDRTDIVDVIERYVPLRKAGVNYQARCPFHSEKTPSFTVSPTKQFYHCFGCGAHGTAISFLMEHAGLGFVDAVKELAARVGLQVPTETAEADGEAQRRRDRLHEAMEHAARCYRDGLKASERAIDYLKRRGLTGQTAARFGLGYAAEDWQGLAGCFGDYRDPLLEEVGLVIAGEGGKRYDRFRGRVMFPIRNERGRVIAFGGRVIGAGEPKYLNSPETSLFHKGRELYGLHEHRRAIQQAGEVLVVEGYMDVVMLDQHGVENAVATLGTAITADHLQRLFRLTDSVVFAFDGDAAGRKAAWRALENGLPQLVDGKRAGFLFLPEGEDPDSYVAGRGAEAFRRQVAQAVPLSDFLLASLKERTDMASQEGQIRLVKLAEPYLRQMTQAPLLAAALRRRLAELTGVSQRSAPVPVRGRPAPRPSKGGRVRPSPWRTLLLAILQDPARAGQLAALPDDPTPAAGLLAAVLDRLRREPQLRTARDIVEAFRGQAEQAALERIAADLLTLGEDYDAAPDLSGALERLREQARRREIEDLSRRRLSDLTPEEQQRLRESLRGGKPDGDPPVQ
ncbi:MAG: DNA primase [Thiobacillaceae bacterium]|jgi:DNA primase|nr:DNA primase [Thiobacillaceae bacterium]